MEYAHAQRLATRDVQQEVMSNELRKLFGSTFGNFNSALTASRGGVPIKRVKAQAEPANMVSLPFSPVSRSGLGSTGFPAGPLGDQHDKLPASKGEPAADEMRMNMQEGLEGFDKKWAERSSFVFQPPEVRSKNDSKARQVKSTHEENDLLRLELKRLSGGFVHSASGPALLTGMGTPVPVPAFKSDKAENRWLRAQATSALLKAWVSASAPGSSQVSTRLPSPTHSVVNLSGRGKC